MSDSEEETYCYFGKPLEPYDEDAFPKKKPISIEDQIATDAQGRRRFHGAFTGGFSAGFFNTVGSLEGWTPTEFKSTRQDKARSKAQKPEDFMDDEDIGQFGIAPETVRATNEFSTSKKRRRQVFSAGPIPGEPVLHSLLTSGNETIGYLLLRNIGNKGKSNTQEADGSADGKVYGCEMPKLYEISHDDITIPEIYKKCLQEPKENTFGLGYQPLGKSHLNLFKSADLVIKEKNKKVLISGQAFGVGAFEDDDEDIYVKDDMSRYDFELTNEKASKKVGSKKEETIFDDFIKAKNLQPQREVFLPPTIPHSFTGKHKVKKSRFEPLPEDTKPPERRDLNPEIRAKYLGEEVDISKDSNSEIETAKAKSHTPEIKKVEDNEEDKKKNSVLFSLDAAGLIFDRFVSPSQPEDTSNILEVVEKSEISHGTQEMRDAARMKMFGPLTRITADWQPCSLLCKRFNVPEPHFDELNASKTRKRTKNLIFEYEQFSDPSVNLKPGLSVKETYENSEIVVENQDVTKERDDVLNINMDTSTSKEEKEEESKQHSTVSAPDITEKIDVSKNIDLFRAVFLSSSESEDETDDRKEDKAVEMKSSILSENLLPKIKPLKEGILSNMDFSIFDIPNNTSSSRTTDDSVIDLNSDIINTSYGPRLPENSTGNSSKLSLGQYEDDDDAHWVEKTHEDKKNKCHKKKHKNKKSSHKKKHKHSKDRE